MNDIFNSMNLFQSFIRLFTKPKKKVFQRVERKYVYVFLIFLIFVSVAWFLLQKGYVNLYQKAGNNDVLTFMKIQSTLYFDPVRIVQYEEGIVLVDIRSKKAYDAEHIKKAINIPVEPKEDKPDDIEALDERISSFKDAARSGKMIVIYDENAYSVQTYKIAYILLTKKIDVKILRIGWNEFRHLQTFWLPEKLWNKVNIIDFIEGTAVIR